MEDKAGCSSYLGTDVILKTMNKCIQNQETSCTISILQVKSLLQSCQSALPLWKLFLEVTT